MTYNNAVKYINTLPEVSLGGSERLRGILSALGSPHKRIKGIQICGDAGKTSCAEMLSAVLTESGYKVGCYSMSPSHDPRERISADGRAIPHAEFAEYVRIISSLSSELSAESTLSRDEIMLAVSIMYFSDKERDAVIFESPLSRSDLSSVDPPILSIVTSIFDSSSNIPFDEIISRGTREVVTCIQHKDVYTRISETCADEGSRLSLPIYADLEIKKISLFKTAFTYRCRDYSISGFSPCQLLNAITVIEAAHALSRLGFSVSEDGCAKGLSRARLPLLCQAIAIEPTIIVASVSNEKHFEAFAASMAQVSELIEGKLRVFVSPNLTEARDSVASRLSSCSIECETPVTLSRAGSPELKSEISEIVTAITSCGDLTSTTVFIGEAEYIRHLTEQIQKKLGSIM